MITQIGRELRKLRIDRGERLLEMSKNLGISVAFLSAIETGRKTPPVDFATRVVQTYDLAPEAGELLTQLCARARHSFQLSAATPLQRDIASELALGFTRLSDDQLRSIKLIIGSEN